MRQLIVLSLLCGCAHATSLREAGEPGLRSIRGEALSARIRFLSDDLLEGRFPGTRGYAIAERYVASELQQLGAEPAGAGGSYLQAVPLRAAHDVDGSASLSIDGEPLKEGDEFLLSSDLRTPQVDVEGELVFAGFAVQ